MINELVDKKAVGVLKPRQHAGAFHAHRLVEEDDDQHRGRGGNKQIARPEADAAVSGLRRGRGGTLRLAGGWGLSVVGDGLHLLLDYPRLFATEAAGRAENGRAVRLG